MFKLLKQLYFVAICVFLLTPLAKATPLQNIIITGKVVPDNTSGTLAGYVGADFVYEASYQLDTTIATDIGTNDGGWTVYELNDGGVKYQNSASLSNGDSYVSNYVLFEFNDNLVEDWASPELGWLNIGVDSGTPLDAVVLGFHDPFITDEIQFYVTLLFEHDLFDGYDPNGLPQSINLAKYVGGGGEFSQYDGDTSNWQGWAQFRVDSVSVSSTPVPEPTTMLLFGTGLASLAGYRRKQNK
ncbi:PEP-CTERM sorting domain-containing protein [Desulfopila sp. IMCC35008]|uniref:PEP-CTERM sorting domain-containing protein n=1 Tax=Desulfopila sp. IMCC35008 TaxID=2653858 RepID=UPI001F0FCD60|nr:PEP-CTERM sorting domain-containing protein [Desulfopila sp. IMCC35008]